MTVVPSPFPVAYLPIVPHPSIYLHVLAHMS
jgi:hypothetical protein